MDAMALLWELLREDGDSPAPPTQEVAPASYTTKSKDKKTLTSDPVCPLPFLSCLLLLIPLTCWQMPSQSPSPVAVPVPESWPDFVAVLPIEVTDPPTNWGHTAVPSTNWGRTAIPRTNRGRTAAPSTNWGPTAVPPTNWGRTAVPSTKSGPVAVSPLKSRVACPNWRHVKIALIKSIREGVFFDRKYWVRHSRTARVLRPLYISSIVVGKNMSHINGCE